MNERVNIFDIAKEAGVSIATVSRVMAGSDKVRPATRDKVMRIVQKYNFSPSMIAAGLSKRKSRTLGMILPLIDNPFYTQMWISAQREAARERYTMILYQVERGTLLTQEFIDELIGRRLDGFVITDDITDESSKASVAECVRQLLRYMPVVAVTPSKSAFDCPTFSSDLAGAMRMSIRHLARLGHERIAMLGGNQIGDVPNTREFSYLSEMRELGLAKHIYPFTRGESPSEGELAVNRLLTQLAVDRAPTALVVFNDITALGAIKQLKKMGYRLPDDMAIVSCDNLFFAPYTEPPLTSVDLKVEDTVSRAIQLLAHAGGPLAPFEQTFAPILVVRESCGA